MRCGAILLLICHLLTAALLYLTGGRLRLLLAIITLLLTLAVLIATLVKKPKWSLAESIAAMLLPLLCAGVGFCMVCGAYPHRAAVGIMYICAFGLSLPLFRRVNACALVFRLAAGFLAFCTLNLLLLGTLAASIGFMSVSSGFSLRSPDGRLAANVLVTDEGALGGRTQVCIVSKGRHGFPSGGGKTIVDCGYIEPEDIRIRWLDERTIEFQGRRCELDG